MRVLPMRIKKRQSGFTLVEILVAFVILGLSAGAVMQVFSASPLRLSAANDRILVNLAASSLLAGIEAQAFLKAGTNNGVLEDGTRWKTQIEPYDIAPASDGDHTRKQISRPYLIKIETGRGDGPHAARTAFTTIRLQAGVP